MRDDCSEHEQCNSARLFTILRPVYDLRVGPLKEHKAGGNANSIPNGCGQLANGRNYWPH